jgi:hypothetical protein
VSAKSKTSSAGGGIHINANTIISAIAALIGGLVLWGVEGGLSTVKKTSESVIKIETSLPFITQAQTDLKASVSEVKASVSKVETSVSDVKAAQMTSEAHGVNKDEFIKNQQRTEELIKSVRDEQSRTREDLRASPHPQK